MSFDIGGAGADIITGAGHVINLPFQGFFWVVDKIRDLPLERRRYSSDVPTLVSMAERIFNAFVVYHKDMLAKTTNWSDDVKEATQRIAKIPFYPLTFCRIGIAFRDAFCEKALGNVAKAISFVFLQIAHAMPYLFIGAIFTAVNLAYRTSPVLLLTTMAGSFLMIQIYLIYRLVKEIELSNKILDEKLDQVNNIYAIIKKTGRGAMEGLQWMVAKVFPKNHKRL